MSKGKYARKRLLKQLRGCPITDAKLSEWITKSLTRANIVTLADLMLCSEEKLKSVPGIGDKAMEELRNLRKTINIR